MAANDSSGSTAVTEALPSGSHLTAPFKGNRNIKTLLITAPNNMEEIAGKAKDIISPTEPFGLMFIASYLEKHGKAVDILDSYALSYTHDEVVDYIVNYEPDIIGYSCLTSQAHELITLTRKVKHKYRKPFLTVYGNIHANIYAEHFLRESIADIVVHDEGEMLMLDLVNTLEEGGSLDEVDGISYLREDGELKRTKTRPPVQNLDDIPMPARHLVPMDKYKMQFYWGPTASNPKTYKAMFTSRGCPFRCTFCNVHHNRAIKYFSIDRVIEEIKLLLSDGETKYIFFLDSLFMTGSRRVKEICEAILAHKLKFQWGCEGRVNLAAKDPELLKLMRKAGCISIAYGIESGVQEILDSVVKNCQVSEIEQAVENTVKAKIQAYGLFILGFPGETPAMTDQTIKFSQKLDLDTAQFAILTPYPGTEIYYDLKSKGELDLMDWDRYTQYAAFTEKKPIFTPKDYPYELLLDKQRQAIRQFYFRPKILWRQIKKFRMYNLYQVLATGVTLTHWTLKQLFNKSRLTLSRGFTDLIAASNR